MISMIMIMITMMAMITFKIKYLQLKLLKAVFLLRAKKKTRMPLGEGGTKNRINYSNS